VDSGRLRILSFQQRCQLDRVLGIYICNKQRAEYKDEVEFRPF
jgi:hypothetical protein